MEKAILILILILAAIINVISGSNRSYFDNRIKKNILKKPTKKFYWTSILTVLIAILSFWQYYLNEQEIEHQRNQSRIEAMSMDSSLKAKYDSSLLVVKYKFDSSYNNTMSILSDNLGKYGYKLDSAGLLVAKLVKDSMKTKVIVGNDPVLGLANSFLEIKQKTDSTLILRLTIESHDAGSTNFRIKFPVIIVDTIKGQTKLRKSEMLTILEPEDQLNKDAQIAKDFTVHYTDTTKYIYIGIFGTYSNIDKSKEFSVDLLIFLNVNGGNSGIISGRRKKDVKSIIPKLFGNTTW